MTTRTYDWNGETREQLIERLNSLAAEKSQSDAAYASEIQTAVSAIPSQFIGNDGWEFAVERLATDHQGLLNAIRSLRRYVFVEGYASHRDDQKSIGFAYDASVWGFTANPEYEAGEALEKCEKWLHSKLDEMLKEAK